MGSMITHNNDRHTVKWSVCEHGDAMAMAMHTPTHVT